MSDCMCGVVGVDLDYHHEHCAVWLKAQLQAANSRLERAEKLLTSWLEIEIGSTISIITRKANTRAYFEVSPTPAPDSPTNE